LAIDEKQFQNESIPLSELRGITFEKTSWFQHIKFSVEAQMRSLVTELVAPVL